jgi:hypothetical protein
MADKFLPVGSATASVGSLPAGFYSFMTLELSKDKGKAHQAWRERHNPVLKGR